MNRIRPTTILIYALVATLGSLPAGAQIYRFPPPDTLSSNFFGASVAIDGHLAVVGATGEEPCGTNSGAAFVYAERTDGTWTRVQTLSPKDCRDDQFFGKEVSIDGSRIAVSTNVPFFAQAASNAVYVFEQGDEGWRQTARIDNPAGSKFGAFASSVSLLGDRLLITSSGDVSEGKSHGAAFVFERNQDGTWIESQRLEGRLPPSAGVFGTSGAMDGDRIIISASNWTRKTPGSVFIFDRDPRTASWNESQVIRGIRDFFISVDVRGDRIIVGEGRGGNERAGRARIFERSEEGVWEESAILLPSTPYIDGGFGSVVSIGDDRALVVGFDEQLAMDINIDRVVYVFHRDPLTGAWSRRRIVDVGQNSFGADVDISGGKAIIGQTSDTAPGQAYVVQIR